MGKIPFLLSCCPLVLPPVPMGCACPPWNGQGVLLVEKFPPGPGFSALAWARRDPLGTSPLHGARGSNVAQVLVGSKLLQQVTVPHWAGQKEGLGFYRSVKCQKTGSFPTVL